MGHAISAEIAKATQYSSCWEDHILEILVIPATPERSLKLRRRAQSGRPLDLQRLRTDELWSKLSPTAGTHTKEHALYLHMKNGCFYLSAVLDHSIVNHHSNENALPKRL